MKPVTISLAAVGLLLTACADTGAQYTPILDGAPMPGFQSDLSACQMLAREAAHPREETWAAAGLGAVAGAILGEWDEEGDPLGGAIAGAVAGGAASAVEGVEAREAVVVECMRGRGHRVVG